MEYSRRGIKLISINICGLLTSYIAYVNRETLEVVLEKPIVLYESITERQNNSNSNSPTLPVELDIENELKMVAEFASTIPNNQLPTEMAKLGIRR